MFSVSVNTQWLREHDEAKGLSQAHKLADFQL